MDPITRLNAALEGRYRIGRELGEGRMTTVELVDDLTKEEGAVELLRLRDELDALDGKPRPIAPSARWLGVLTVPLLIAIWMIEPPLLVFYAAFVLGMPLLSALFTWDLRLRRRREILSRIRHMEDPQ